MSWHTPARAVHASDAGVCTVVTPGMYSISSRSAAAHGERRLGRLEVRPPRAAPARPRPRAARWSACRTGTPPAGPAARRRAACPRSPGDRSGAALGHLDEVLGGDHHRLVRREHLERRDGRAPVVAVLVPATCAAARRACVSSTVCPCWDSGVIRASLYDASTALAYRNVDGVHARGSRLTAPLPPSSSTAALGKYRPRIASRGRRAGALHALHLLGQRVEHLDQRAVLEVGARRARCAGARRRPRRGPRSPSSAGQARLRLVEREHDRPREQPVDQQEPGGALVGRRAAVRAQEGLVRAARAQQRRPAGPGRARRARAW